MVLRRPSFVRQMPAQQRRSKAADAVSADGKPGLSNGVTLASEIQRKERHNERAELVDERAKEKNPRRTRQRFKLDSNVGPGFAEFGLLVFMETKTLLTVQQAGLEKISFVR